jgi:hypothetical protein
LTKNILNKLALIALRPIIFGPGTLWRTQGTRPIPPGLAMTQTPAGLTS